MCSEICKFEVTDSDGYCYLSLLLEVANNKAFDKLEKLKMSETIWGMCNQSFVSILVIIQFNHFKLLIKIKTNVIIYWLILIIFQHTNKTGKNILITSF